MQPNLFQFKAKAADQTVCWKHPNWFANSTVTRVVLGVDVQTCFELSS